MRSKEEIKLVTIMKTSYHELLMLYRLYSGKHRHWMGDYERKREAIVEEVKRLWKEDYEA